MQVHVPSKRRIEVQPLTRHQVHGLLTFLQSTEKFMMVSGTFRRYRSRCLYTRRCVGRGGQALCHALSVDCWRWWCCSLCAGGEPIDSQDVEYYRMLSSARAGEVLQAAMLH